METIKHKIEFQVPDSTLKSYEFKELTVSQDFDGKDAIFSVQVPTNIYDQLVDTQKKYRSYAKMKEDKKEAKKRGIQTFESDRDTYLSKTLKSKLISDLKDQLFHLSLDVVNINTKEDLKKDKKIFISFDSSSHMQRNNSHSYMGKKTTSSFQFFVGYKTVEKNHISSKLSNKYYTYFKYGNVKIGDNETKLMETTELHPLNAGYNQIDIEKSFDIIERTQEREDYLTNLEAKFVELNEKIATFLGNIDDQKIESLMANTNFPLLDS